MQFFLYSQTTPHVLIDLGAEKFVKNSPHGRKGQAKPHVVLPFLCHLSPPPQKKFWGGPQIFHHTFYCWNIKIFFGDPPKKNFFLGGGGLKWHKKGKFCWEKARLGIHFLKNFEMIFIQLEVSKRTFGPQSFHSCQKRWGLSVFREFKSSKRTLGAFLTVENKTIVGF